MLSDYTMPMAIGLDYWQSFARSQVFEVIYPHEGPKVSKGMQLNKKLPRHHGMTTSDRLIAYHAWRCHFLKREHHL